MVYSLLLTYRPEETKSPSDINDVAFVGNTMGVYNVNGYFEPIRDHDNNPIVFREEDIANFIRSKQDQSQTAGEMLGSIWADDKEVSKIQKETQKEQEASFRNTTMGKLLRTANVANTIAGRFVINLFQRDASYDPVNYVFKGNLPKNQYEEVERMSKTTEVDDGASAYTSELPGHEMFHEMAFSFAVEQREKLAKYEKDPRFKRETVFEAPISEVKVKYVYDGDTVKLDIPSASAFWGKGLNIRLRDIDTPEIRGGTALTRQKANLAKQYFERRLRGGGQITFDGFALDKYRRVVADIYIDGKSVSAELVDLGLAISVDYDKKEANKEFDRGR